MSNRIKSLFSAYFILFLDNFGFAIIFPIFPVIFLNKAFTILPAQTPEAMRNIYLGLILAAFPFAQFFGAPFFGDVADRLGRKRALFLTISGTIIGYFLTAIGIFTKLYALIFVSRVITGFFSGNLAISMAIIADLNTERKKRARSLSYVSAFLGFSWIFAIIVGSFFANPKNIILDPSFPFIIIGVLSLISLLVLWIFYHETAQLKPNRQLHIFKSVHDVIHILEFKQLRVLFLTLFFWFFGFFITMQWTVSIAIEKYHVKTDQILWLLVSQGILWSLSGIFLNPWLIERFSLWKIVVWSLFLISLLYFFGAVSTFFFYFAAAFAISGIFASIAWGDSVSLISLSTTGEEQGKSLGIAQSMQATAQFLGPLFGGLIAGFHIKIIYYTTALLVFISFLLLLIYILRKKGDLFSNN